MAQAQIDRKRSRVEQALETSLIEQALEASLIELKKPRKEKPTNLKEKKKKKKKKKEKPMALKKAEQMAKLRTEELRHFEELKKKKKKKKNRPPLPKLNIEEAKKKAAMEREAKNRLFEEMTGDELTRLIGVAIQKEDERYVTFLKEHEALMNKNKNNPPLSILKIEEANKKAEAKMDMPSSITPNACDDEKIAAKVKEEDWVTISCPDGVEGCEVLHIVKRSPPPRSPVNTSPVKPNEGMNPIDPDEIQSIDVIHDMIFARGKASTQQCYWGLIIDALVIALIHYCHEMCEGCKSDNRKKHDLCDLPVKTVWSKNRKAILSRVDVPTLMGKWTSSVYISCGIRPSEVETLFSLCNPGTMITRWHEDLQGGDANTKVDYDGYDLERVPWRKDVNTRMAKINHPSSYCSFDIGLAPFLQKTF